MIPSPNNPLVLRYMGQPPALKNSKLPIYDAAGKLDKLIPNQEVLQYIKKTEVVRKQVVKQGFEKMAFPTPVACYVEIYLAIGKAHNIPKDDGDNAYTMLQETWQDPNIVGGLGAVLGVIDDDRQLLSVQFETIPIRSEKLEGAIVYLWALDLDADRFEQRETFVAWYREQKSKRFEDMPTIDFDEMDELF